MGARPPQDVQFSASMKDGRLATRPKPDKVVSHLKIICDRHLPQRLKFLAHREKTRKSLFLCLLRFSPYQQLVRLVRHLLRNLDRYLTQVPFFGITSFAAAGFGGFSGGDAALIGRRPPSKLNLAGFIGGSGCNCGLQGITASAMTIDETTQKVEEEQARKQTPEKKGVIKRLVVAGLVMLSLGMYHPKDASAGGVNFGADNKTGQSSSSMSIGQGTDVKINKDGSTMQGVRLGDGIIAYPDGSSSTVLGKGRGGDEEQPTYKNKISEYDAAIAKDPTSAKLYIAKADEMIRNKVPPQEIINTLENAIKNRLKGTNEEVALLHYNLSQNYCQQKNYKKALPLLEKVKNIKPDYPYIDFAIEQTKKAIK